VAYDELGPRFFDALAAEIGRRLEDCGKSVPVVTGMTHVSLFTRNFAERHAQVSLE
jgi:hypothetical protein